MGVETHYGIPMKPSQLDRIEALLISINNELKKLNKNADNKHPKETKEGKDGSKQNRGKGTKTQELQQTSVEKPKTDVPEE